MESNAKLSSVRLSPRKTRLVVDLVRGKGIQDALNILRFMPQPSAKLVSKLLKSAVSNAEQKGVSDVEGEATTNYLVELLKPTGVSTITATGTRATTSK